MRLPHPTMPRACLAALLLCHPAGAVPPTVAPPAVPQSSLGQPGGPPQLGSNGRLMPGAQPPQTLALGLAPAAPVTAPAAWASSAVTTTLTKTATSSITGATAIPATCTCIRYFGPPVTLNATTTYYGVYSMASNAGGPYKMSFWSDAAKLDLRLVGSNAQVEVRVNGQTVPVGGASMISTDTSGQPYILDLDWTVGGTVSAGTQVPRKYEIQGLNFSQKGLYIGAASATSTDSVWYPVEDDLKAPFLAFGDSYTNGTGAADYWQTAAATMADLLGYEYWADGYGGSGYCSSAAGQTIAARLPLGIFAVRTADGAGTIKPRPTPVVAVLLGYNDSSCALPTLSAQWTSFYALTRAAMGPLVPIITYGPWTPLGPTAALTAVEATLQAAVAAASGSDRLLAFVSLDNIIAPANDGRYGFGDNTHPNPTGHLFIGTQAGQRTRAAGF